MIFWERLIFVKRRLRTTRVAGGWSNAERARPGGLGNKRLESRGCQHTGRPHGLATRQHAGTKQALNPWEARGQRPAGEHRQVQRTGRTGRGRLLRRTPGRGGGARRAQGRRTVVGVADDLCFLEGRELLERGNEHRIRHLRGSSKPGSGDGGNTPSRQRGQARALGWARGSARRCCVREIRHAAAARDCSAPPQQGRQRSNVQPTQPAGCRPQAGSPGCPASAGCGGVGPSVSHPQLARLCLL